MESSSGDGQNDYFDRCRAPSAATGVREDVFSVVSRKLRTMASSGDACT